MNKTGAVTDNTKQLRTHDKTVFGDTRTKAILQEGKFLCKKASRTPRFEVEDLLQALDDVLLRESGTQGPGQWDNGLESDKAH